MEYNMAILDLPSNPNFSSGPCAKRPGWTSSNIDNALLGRSHRSKDCLLKIQKVITETKDILNIPKDYKIAIVGGSDTGAFEMAMWSLLGLKPIDILAWESFGRDWVKDVIDQLKIPNTSLIEADYGKLPDLESVNFENDVIFTWNGTTSGVKVPNGDWISPNRMGLTLCDATSAVFAMEIPWKKLDVTSFSWQKVLGGEAQHGILVMSPRAIIRLEKYTPSWPIPKLFRLANKGKVQDKIFNGSTINTPSMMCIEDVLDSLIWVRNIGGLEAMINRSSNNLKAIEKWEKENNWIEFLAKDKSFRSSTSICLRIIDEWFINKNEDERKSILNFFHEKLAIKNIAFDINSYGSAPLGIRIWGGGTVETKDIELLLPWINKIWLEIKNNNMEQLNA
tara:strand:+ start:2086 stop:3267 length:1182 start_codon:yes stop_codon:yes gene_type:complete